MTNEHIQALQEQAQRGGTAAGPYREGDGEEDEDACGAGVMSDDPTPEQRRKRLIRWGIPECRRCGKVKSRSAFGTTPTGRVTLNCNACRKALDHESYLRRRDKKRAQASQSSCALQQPQPKPAEELGPRKRRQRLMELGLVECCRCKRTLPIDQMSKQGRGRVGPCRECEAKKQRELRARPPKPSPDGPRPLSAPIIRGTYDPAMEKAIAYAKEVLAGIRRGA